MRSRLEQDLQLDAKLAREAEDLKALADLAGEGEDVLSELTGEVNKLEQETQHTEIRMLLSGEHDMSNAIVTIHPGAGGLESQDWAEMLIRMYMRWAERSGFSTKGRRGGDQVLNIHC
jgi:peptide chain release factor 2